MFAKAIVRSLLAMALNCSTLALAVEYTFTRVYTGNVNPCVAINDSGLVALFNGTSLITTDGHTSTVLADIVGETAPNRLLDASQLFSLNNNGFVAFRGYASDGTYGILASNGPVTHQIATGNAITNQGGAFWYIPKAAMSINDSGMVTFMAAQTATSGWHIYVGDGTATPVQLSEHYGCVPAMNNAETVAYVQYDSGTRSYSIEIQKGMETLSLPGVNDVIYMPDINNSGTAACVVAAKSIVIGDGVSPPAYIDGSLYLGPLDGGCYFDAGASACAINDQGLVVFQAHPLAITPTYTPSGLFVGPNPATDKVIMEGDLLDGATINLMSLSFCRNGLNNSGQIAFTAALSDGTQGVWVAMPVPEASSIAMLAGIGLTALLYRWRKRA
jgi:hypothetical protein